MIFDPGHIIFRKRRQIFFSAGGMRMSLRRGCLAGKFTTCAAGAAHLRSFAAVISTFGYDTV